MIEVFLGIDVGTTGTKALIVDKNGKVLGSGYESYNLIQKPNNIAEQDAEDWKLSVIAAVKQALGKLDSAKLKGIGVSTQGASSVFVDEFNNPLAPVITWLDTRSKFIATELEKITPQDYFYEKTGWKLSPTQDATKALWTKRNQPNVYNNSAKYISTLEYINYFLTGHWVIDPTNAAMRQMMNLQEKKWDSDILKLIEMDIEKLPEIKKTGECLGNLSETASKLLGIPSTVPVYNGIHDQYASSIGSNTITPGQMMVGTGTAWIIMGITEEPMFTKSYICPGPHGIDDLWGGMASLLSCGAALDWITKIGKIDYNDLEKEISPKVGKANNLLFYPYLTGEGFPNVDPNKGGSFCNLKLSDDSADLALAVMEGVAFQLALALEEHSKTGIAINAITIMGGALKSNSWLKIINAVVPCVVNIVENENASALGAGIIASVGSGAFSSYSEACATMVRSVQMKMEDDALCSYYQAKFKKFKDGKFDKSLHLA